MTNDGIKTIADIVRSVMDEYDQNPGLLAEEMAVAKIKSLKDGWPLMKLLGIKLSVG